VIILEYLHQTKIIHRDVKPENFMLDHQVISLSFCKGYLKAIDFGIAKQLKGKNDLLVMRTFTIIGTPHYTAPEVIQTKGYSYLVDLWSLGICLYEYEII
jgi:cGMP-dependent protein kinase